MTEYGGRLEAVITEIKAMQWPRSISQPATMFKAEE